MTITEEILYGKLKLLRQKNYIMQRKLFSTLQNNYSSKEKGIYKIWENVVQHKYTVEVGKETNIDFKRFQLNTIYSLMKFIVVVKQNSTPIIQSI